MSAEAVLVLGAGGHAKVVVAALLELGVEVGEVVDDDQARRGELLGVPVGGPLAGAALAGRRAVLAIGDNAVRRRLSGELDAVWQTVVHPTARVHASARLGAGVFVAAGAIVQPDTVVGRHAIVNTGATVDHDCVVEPFAHLGPGTHLAGGVTIGEGALVGVGGCVAPGVRVGRWAVLGAGAVAVRDIADGATAVGVPARVRHGG